VQEKDNREVAADEAAGDAASSRGSLFDGFYRARTARTGCACCSSPGVFTPARSDGEQRTGLQDQE
jgi:predicted acylesterase/phospholipase RssA